MPLMTPRAIKWLRSFAWKVVAVQPFSCVWLFATPWTAARQASQSFTVSWNLLKLTSIESVMPSNHLILLLLSIFPRIRERFPVTQLFTSGGQSTGASTSASVLPMNIQGCFPLGLIGLILQSEGLSRIFSSTTVWKHQFFSTKSLYGATFTSIHDYRKNHNFDFCLESE